MTTPRESTAILLAEMEAEGFPPEAFDRIVIPPGCDLRERYWSAGHRAAVEAAEASEQDSGSQWQAGFRNG